MIQIHPSADPAWRPEVTEVAIVTAMDDELRPVLEVAPTWREFSLDGFPHYYTEIEQGTTDSIHAVACSLWKYGQLPTASAVLRLRQLRPKLVVMTGICAGWREKDVQFGDVVVATRAFSPMEGKRNTRGTDYDTDTFRPKPWLIKQLQSYELHSNWQRDIREPRPESLRFLGDLVLCALDREPSFYDNQGVQELIREHSVDAMEVMEWLRNKSYLNKNGKLSPKGRGRLRSIRLMSGGELVPPADRAEPKVHFGTIATDQAVVAVEEPFSSASQRVRSVRALEMEIAALYQAVEELDGILAFAVKGVSDHATPEKDDRFRIYAAEVSAKWALGFIKSKSQWLFASRDEPSDEKEDGTKSGETRSTTTRVFSIEFDLNQQVFVYNLHDADTSVPKNLAEEFEQLRKENRSLRREIRSIRRLLLSTTELADHPQLLLVTNLDIETKVLLDLLQEQTTREAIPVHTPVVTYFDCGVIANARLIVFQNAFRGSHWHQELRNLLATEAALAPSAIILTGVAGGIGRHWQNIGDILVSSAVIDLEPGSELVSEGKHIIDHTCISFPSSQRLLQRINSYALGWTEAKVHIGKIMSGTPTLMLSRAGAADRVIEFDRTIIGLEIGARALHGLPPQSTNWVVIKGVCDLGDSRKVFGEEKQIAMENVTRFLLHIIEGLLS